MTRGTFFENKGPFTLAQIAEFGGAELENDTDQSATLSGVASIAAATASQVTFFHDRRYIADLKTTFAGAVVVSKSMRQHIPDTAVPILSDLPELAFAQVIGGFYPDAVRPGAGFTVTRDSAYFGDIDVTVDVNGVVSGELSDPGAGIETVKIEGAVTATQIMIKYTVDFGGSTAVGFTWLTKS